jgi:DNA-binding transcriptional MerR regulator
MSQPAVVIPEKLFFKIGEVCELAGVQAHVLRYWETEFPTLAPQKNRAGQRTYRRRDVEMALRIKELLYDEQYTIAGAKKKLATEIRGGGSRESSQTTPARILSRSLSPPPSLAGRVGTTAVPPPTGAAPNDDQRAALLEIAKELREILDLLDEGESDLMTAQAKKR